MVDNNNSIIFLVDTIYSILVVVDTICSIIVMVDNGHNSGRSIMLLVTVVYSFKKLQNLPRGVLYIHKRKNKIIKLLKIKIYICSVFSYLNFLFIISFVSISFHLSIIHTLHHYFVYLSPFTHTTLNHITKAKCCVKNLPVCFIKCFCLFHKVFLCYMCYCFVNVLLLSKTIASSVT